MRLRGNLGGVSRVVIADLPQDERPRERMARHGAEALSDAELLSILIGPGRPGKSSIDYAREALSDGLQSLARKEWLPGRRVGSLGGARVARIGAALELGRRIGSHAAAGSDPVRHPDSLGPSLVARYSHHVQERLGAILLDSRNRVIREREIYLGTLNSSTVSTRDVLRFALDDHAVSVVVFHNHPSGDPSPSGEDLIFTRRLVEAGKLMAVDIVDHLIVGAGRYVSLKERGFM